jgi:serine/threonine protein kinase
MPTFNDDKTPEEDGFPQFNTYFTFIKNIGSGGFGKVVLARLNENKKTYAVKVIILPYSLLNPK